MVNANYQITVYSSLTQAITVNSIQNIKSLAYQRSLLRNPKIHVTRFKFENNESYDTEAILQPKATVFSCLQGLEK